MTSASTLLQSTDTPTPTWEPLYKTPTPAPTKDTACCEGTPEGWGSCTPAPEWLLNCNQCAPVPTSEYFGEHTPWPTFIPPPSVTPTPTVSGTITPSPSVTPTPSGAVTTTYGIVFDRGLSCPSDPMDIASWAIANGGLVGDLTEPKFVHVGPVGGVEPSQIYNDMIVCIPEGGELDLYSFESFGYAPRLVQYQWHYHVCDGTDCNAGEFEVTEDQVNTQGCQTDWNDARGVTAIYGSHFDLSAPVGGPSVQRWGVQARWGVWRHTTYCSWDWVEGYLESYFYLAPDGYNPSPTETPTPTPTGTPTITPTPVSGTYCCTLECDPGGDPSSGTLPVISIGQGTCVTFSPVDLSLLGLGELPGFEMCLTPIRFGSLGILGVSISLDFLSSVLAGLALRLLWRS